jgi:hypothetical protein
MLALCYGELCRYDESVRYAERALSLKRSAKTLADMAYAYTNGGDWDLADKLSLEALKLATEKDIDPTRDALVSQAYCRLAKKDWRSGFEGFRHTLRTKWRKEWTYGDSVEWSGEPDAVVMVTGEQGLGDEIMAASVVPDAARTCKTFILDCDHRLEALFKRSFPNVLVTPTRRSDKVVLPVMPTHHKSLFGLSELFRHEDTDFPRKPYLAANPAYVAMFKTLLGDDAVGLAWSGGLPRTGQEPRTAGLTRFCPCCAKAATLSACNTRTTPKK